MRLLTLLALVVATLALSTASPAAAHLPEGAATAAAKQKESKKKAKRKAARRKAARRRAAVSKPRTKRRSCRRGYVLRTVRIKRRGKVARVKRCRRRRKATKAPVAVPNGPMAPAPGAAPPPGAAKPLFDPPGRTLEGAAARTYIERYLHDSRFADCPSTDPGCQSERRYSFSLAGPPKLWDFDFHACQLPSPGGSGLAFFYETGIVRPDGAWSFNGIVALSGLSSFYDWSVAADGTVTGFHKPFGGMPVEIAPLRYAAGARGCSA